MAVTVFLLTSTRIAFSLIADFLWSHLSDENQRELDSLLIQADVSSEVSTAQNQLCSDITEMWSLQLYSSYTGIISNGKLNLHKVCTLYRQSMQLVFYRKKVK